MPKPNKRKSLAQNAYAIKKIKSDIPTTSIDHNPPEPTPLVESSIPISRASILFFFSNPDL